MGVPCLPYPPRCGGGLGKREVTHASVLRPVRGGGGTGRGRAGGRCEGNRHFPNFLFRRVRVLRKDLGFLGGGPEGW